MTKQLVYIKRMVIGHPFLFVLFCLFTTQLRSEAFFVLKNKVLLHDSINFQGLNKDQTNYLKTLQETIYLFLEGTQSSSPNYHFEQEELEAEYFFLLGVQEMLQKNQVNAILKFKKSYNLHKRNLIKQPESKTSLKSIAILSIVINEMNEYNQFASTIIKAEWSNQKSFDALEDLKKVKEYELEISLLEVLLFEFVRYEYDKASGIINKLIIDYPNNQFINYLGAIICTKNKASAKALMYLAKSNSSWSEYYYIRGKNNYYLLNDQKAREDFSKYLTIGKPALVSKTNTYLYLISGTEQKDINKGKVDQKKELGPLFHNLRLFDAGEFDVVLDNLNQVDYNSLQKNERLWYHYLKARSLQYLDNRSSAKVQFLELLYKCDFSNTNYIIPFSCYQMSLIFKAEKNNIKALKYLDLGLQYKKYPHQDMIRVKMNQLKTELND